MSAFTRMCTVTASTKRTPAISSGKIGALATQVAGLTCTPLDPVSAEIRTRMGLESAHEVVQTFTEETDIREGDYLVVSGKEYPIRAVAEWTWRGRVYRHLIMEDVKA
jgi:hypothetical protein